MKVRPSDGFDTAGTLVRRGCSCELTLLSDSEIVRFQSRGLSCTDQGKTFVPVVVGWLERGKARPRIPIYQYLGLDLMASACGLACSVYVELLPFGKWRQRSVRWWPWTRRNAPEHAV